MACTGQRQGEGSCMNNNTQAVGGGGLRNGSRGEHQSSLMTVRICTHLSRRHRYTYMRMYLSVQRALSATLRSNAPKPPNLLSARTVSTNCAWANREAQNFFGNGLHPSSQIVTLNVYNMCTISHVFCVYKICTLYTRHVQVCRPYMGKAVHAQCLVSVRNVSMCECLHACAASTTTLPIYFTRCKIVSSTVSQTPGSASNPWMWQIAHPLREQDQGIKHGGRLQIYNAYVCMCISHVIHVCNM